MSLDDRPLTLPLAWLYPPAEVALLDQLDAAHRHTTALEIRVNRLERELIALRAQRDEVDVELAHVRILLGLDAA